MGRRLFILFRYKTSNTAKPKRMSLTKIGRIITVFAFVLNVLSCTNTRSDTTEPLTDKSYHIQLKVLVKNMRASLSTLSIILPLAQTNQYQEVRNVNISGGTQFDFADTDDKYICWFTTSTSNLPAPGGQIETGYDFDITLHSFSFDFSQVKTIYPYNVSTDIYRWYTSQRGEYLVPNNPTIIRIGDELWAQSQDIVDYARRCYEYVARNYRHLYPNTGLHTLEKILADGGGDCGNLSSIFISLLRYKKIPCRPIVTVLPNNTFHVWSDFYLESYGWIPVDVTFKNSNPAGDYFGKYDGSGIVFSKQYWLLLKMGENNDRWASFLQTFAWWWTGKGMENDMEATYSILSRSI